MMGVSLLTKTIEHCRGYQYLDDRHRRQSRHGRQRTKRRDIFIEGFWEHSRPFFSPLGNAGRYFVVSA
jgi:hypothetical protein